MVGQDSGVSGQRLKAPTRGHHQPRQCLWLVSVCAMHLSSWPCTTMPLSWTLAVTLWSKEIWPTRVPPHRVGLQDIRPRYPLILHYDKTFADQNFRNLLVFLPVSRNSNGQELKSRHRVKLGLLGGEYTGTVRNARLVDVRESRLR